MERLVGYVGSLIKGSRFSTEPTGASFVTSTRRAPLEQGVQSILKVDDTPELITLLQEVLVFDPQRRPDVSDILNHPWFAGMLVPTSLSGWEGLPPPPVFMTGEPKPPGANEVDPAVTPVATPLELPDGEPELLPLPFESFTTAEVDTHPVSPATWSPSLSTDTTLASSVVWSPPSSTITLSDFTTDDEFPAGPTVATPYESLYFADGNVEVLCKNTLFRVHASTVSSYSHTLRRMFAQTNLATAEAPNGCPRLLSSDTPEDFATLLKIIYLPGFVASPPYRWILPLTIWLCAGSLRRMGFQISSLFHPSSELRQMTRCRISGLGYLSSSVTRTRRISRVPLLQSRSERAPSEDRSLTRMRSSTSLFSRDSHLHYRWHTTWRLEGVWIR